MVFPAKLKLLLEICLFTSPMGLLCWANYTLIDILSRVCEGACRHTPDIPVELGN